MNINPEGIDDCITQCWKCHSYCQKTFFNHCLMEDGEHLEINHVRLMMDCIQMCQTAADFMIRNSPLHNLICNVCADICTACAESCEQIEDSKMKQCAKVCRKCAESCREMSIKIN